MFLVIKLSLRIFVESYSDCTVYYCKENVAHVCLRELWVWHRMAPQRLVTGSIPRELIVTKS